MIPRSRLALIARYGLRRAKWAAYRPLRTWMRWYVRAEPPRETAYTHPRVFIMLASAWGMGGTIRTVHTLAGHLAKTYDVEIVSLVRRGEKPFFKFAPGVNVTALDDRRPGAASPWPGIVRKVLCGRSSALMHPADHASAESNLWMDFMLVRKLRRQSGFLIGTRPALNLIAADLSPPGLITIGQEHMHLRAHSRPLKGAMKRLYPMLDVLTVLTERDLLEYEKQLSGRVRLVHIPNPVGDMPGPKADLGARTVLAAGRLTYQKGFDMLIQAFGPIASAHPGWRLRICGRGRLRRDLQGLIRDEGLSHVVELPGPRDLDEEMARASLFVLSSRFEGFPIVLLEAMSKGMAIASFDCPTGPVEIVDDRRNGILVPFGDVDALANAMLELIEDEDLRRSCAAAAVETARSYSIDAIGSRWDALLEQLEQAQTPAPVDPRMASLDSPQ